MTDDNEIIEFTIKCKMKRRWASQFIGMLNQMQYLGNVGSSRNISFFADGDGDFRPIFKIDSTIVAAEPVVYKSGDTFFDAG